MVRPLNESAPSSVDLLCWRARARAATSIAGSSRNLPTRRSDVSRDRTSRSRASSPEHAWRRNGSRSSGGRSSTDCSMSSTCFHRSEFICGPAGQLAVEPGPGRPPVALNSDSRYFEHLGSLFHAESAKEAHFHNLHFAWIDSRQPVHRVIERQQVHVLIAAHDGCLFQGDVLHATSAFQVVAPRVLYQNAPHQLGRNREEMGAILPLHALVIHQAHVGFIDQGRGLEAVAGALAFHVALRQTVELVINDGGQPVECASIPVSPGSEQLAHLAGRRRYHVILLCRHSDRPVLSIIAPSSVSSSEFSLRDTSHPPFAPI